MNKIQNIHLYKAFEKFTKTSFELLDKKLAKEKLEIGLTEEIKFHDRGLERQFKSYPRLFLVVRKYRKELQSLKETDECIQLMRKEGILQEPKLSDSTGNPIENPTEEQIKPFLAMDLMAFIEKLTDVIGSFKFNGSKFQELYRQHEDYWYTNEIEYQLIIPLFNFESELKEIELNGAKIEIFTDKEKEKIANSLPFGSFIQDHEFIDIKFKLNIPFFFGNNPRTNPRADQRTLEKAEKILTALRLFKGGGVYYTATYSMPVKLNPYHGISSEISIERDLHLRGSKFILMKNEVQQLKEILLELEKMEDTSLDIAFRKFNDSYGRNNLEDKIIDYTICFESTILHDIDEELAYRLALRTSTLLKDTNNKEFTFKLMRELYKIRSKIVHQGMKLERSATIKITDLNKEIPTIEFIAIVEDLLRKTIRKYIGGILNGETIKEINKELDELQYK